MEYIRFMCGLYMNYICIITEYGIEQDRYKNGTRIKKEGIIWEEIVSSNFSAKVSLKIKLIF